MSMNWAMRVNERVKSDDIRVRPVEDRKIRLVIETEDEIVGTDLTLDEWYELVAMGNELAGEIRSNWNRLGGDDE